MLIVFHIFIWNLLDKVDTNSSMSNNEWQWDGWKYRILANSPFFCFIFLFFPPYREQWNDELTWLAYMKYFDLPPWPASAVTRCPFCEHIHHSLCRVEHSAGAVTLLWCFLLVICPSYLLPITYTYIYEHMSVEVDYRIFRTTGHT